jgi:serine/threonine-protein kinase SRK2
MTPKLCDFGSAKLVRQNEKNFGKYGTPVFMAPEIWTDRGYYGFASDVWSLGVILFTMLAGEVPFVADNLQKLSK